jgi:hypothetical protein
MSDCVVPFTSLSLKFGFLTYKIVQKYEAKTNILSTGGDALSAWEYKHISHIQVSLFLYFPTSMLIHKF